MPLALDPARALNVVRQCMPGTMPELLAVYLFGSHAQGNHGPDSDVDLALLVAGKAEPVALWHMGQAIASQLNRDVDLLDLRAASTVMQYQIIYYGQRLWARDDQAALYESFILSEKTALDTFRAGIVADVETRGRVYA